MTNKNVLNGCPGSEILEEYRDGTASDEWTAHIDKCEECQRRIASLDLLDMRLRRVCLPPDGMASRIKAAVHEGREPSIRPIPFWRNGWFRATAASSIVLLLLSASVYFALDNDARNYDASTGTTSNQFTSNDDAMFDNGIEERQVAAAANAAPVAEAVRHEPSTALSFDSKVRLAGTLGESSAAKRTINVAKKPLGEAVRHLWSVEKNDDALELIRKIAKVNGKDVEIEQIAGGFNASITLRDTELQQLVDMLNKDGWRLLSPYAPQPGEEEAVEFRNNPVTYYIKVIEKGQ